MSRISEVRSPYVIIDADEKGIGFPFLRSREGMFTRRYGLDVLIDDILALIHINPGEYPNDPELGVGIRRYLFELMDVSLSLSLEDRIESQLLKYMSNIKLIGVDVGVISEQKSIEITIRFQKREGSRDIIRFSNIVNDKGDSTLSVGVAA